MGAQTTGIKPARDSTATSIPVEGASLPSSYPTSRMKIDADRCIDDVRPLRVAVVGAGLSGIIAGILLPAKVPGIELTIFEKNDDVGGTWLENAYPGLRCDTFAHVYQCTFLPNTNWTETIATGAEILQYWKDQADKYDVHRYIKPSHRVESASWDGALKSWTVTVHNTKTSKTGVELFDFVILAIGRYNALKLPDYPGVGEFRGHLRHTSNWDSSYGLSGKRVALIGNGASGVQILPELQKLAGHVTHYARNPTWIAAAIPNTEHTFQSQPYTKEQLESFKDPEVYLDFRKQLEGAYWRKYKGMLKSEENVALTKALVAGMTKRLAGRPELIKHLIPDFSPHCRRLTFGPGYLEALLEDNVDFVATRINRFTATGIETIDGDHREFDAIFCATGANSDMAPPFSITAGGVDLKSAWKPGGKFGFPYTYLGAATPGFPNLLYVGGPHASGPAGTVVHSVENQITYCARILRKVSSQGIASITPSQKAADDFVDYCDAYFPTTVLTDHCASWNNGGIIGARIHGLWPGTATHLTAVRREPRWEDWEYEYASTSGNRFEYWGSGHTRKETDMSVDMTSYLRLPGQVDLRTIHESG
ncbi:hypothetical protein COCMIDRAFT_29073 [Bipolaris oryzae ATCC 44560]|uniref:FAD/NAD(P)-binding domain-containing protein n=1 Tax=Bipolaris oryzae ATCC 44560 TaxID=930090 RepID=W6YXI9_COCMI|nr:uncharacterized protein COCMIDRAFT_29073 [Bipolaris oryzae ATCC 44560]EUC42260.1 hypothetical protein COCMIDRAFT_29073 [Bipolaris oryzae ATCC 44560]